MAIYFRFNISFISISSYTEQGESGGR
ncbi:hypothetical protein Zm00014a_034626 [Zea mays]|uniref:Uncharacterized protein n=1 Tax=Zea mays TaxID=4577 RepID=A0A3L6G5V6_MAIZE|nr:hypothetical protein Zm00014a_034626 [Zea mays]